MFIALNLHIMVNSRRVLPLCIAFCLPTMDNRCSVWTFRVSRGMCTSISVYHAWTSRITLRLHTASSPHWTWAAHIGRGLPTSLVVYKVLNWLLSWTTYSDVLVHIARLASANKRQRRPLLLRIERVMSANDMKYQPRPTQMSLGMCTSSRYHQCHVTIGSIFEGMCISTKKCHPIERSIIRET